MRKALVIFWLVALAGFRPLSIPSLSDQAQAAEGERNVVVEGDLTRRFEAGRRWAVEFCRRLSQKEGKQYRLPTAAEWEYACRAGSSTKWCCGDDEASLGEYAWYGGNSDMMTHPVGQKRPNAWGLYDMHGNVWEWCQDWWGDYGSDAVSDPTGPSSGSSRVLRGGGWLFPAEDCHSSFRGGNTPEYRSDSLGLRVLLAAK